MQKTLEQYDAIIQGCRKLYEQKTQDYGTAWRILRTTSLTDQLYIKAKRIRGIEENEVQKIAEGVDSEYIGLVNYSIMAIIQLNMGNEEAIYLKPDEALAFYDKEAQKARALMIKKNHDYGEVWREMRISSITDLILMKLLRVKQIEDNQGQTLVSEGLEANYQDIINYAIFALIKIEEQKQQ